jgi:hypothetical protein
MGQERMNELVPRNFLLPQIEPWIEHYVQLYSHCEMDTTAHRVSNGLQQPLELAYRPWDAISFNLIVDLPLSIGCSSMWVVVEHFTTMSYCIPHKNGEQQAPDLVHIFLEAICSHNAILSTITSDRVTRFTSMIWKGIIDTLGIKSTMSSPVHPQTDRQTERIT